SGQLVDPFVPGPVPPPGAAKTPVLSCAPLFQIEESEAMAQPVSSPSAAVADRSFFGHPRGLSTLLFTAMVWLTAMPGGWLADRLLGQRRAVLWGGVIIALGHVSLTFHGLPTFYLGLFLIVTGTGLLKPNISTMVGRLYPPDDARRDSGFSIFYMGINLGAFGAPLVCGFLAQSEQFRGFLARQGLRPEDSWHWGFGAAAVGMALGLIQYTLGGKRLGGVGLEPARP